MLACYPSRNTFRKVIILADINNLIEQVFVAKFIKNLFYSLRVSEAPDDIQTAVKPLGPVESITS